MITLEAPHVGLNSIDTWSQVRMWRTPGRIRRNKSVPEILDLVVHYARQADGGRIRNLVFSCHGQSGILWIGTGISQTETHCFEVLRGLVDKIWFHACSVAARNPEFHDRAGHQFCSSIARTAQCHVVASTELQVGTRGRILPYGRLDTFEGLVVSYNPAGEISWRHRYPSTYFREGNPQQNPD